MTGPMHILASRATSDATLLEQVATFFSFQHVTLVYGAIGAVLLGVCCGLLGCFIVLRKMSLIGDSIGHAVLPGICVAFVIMRTKSVGAIFLGAVVAGVLATWVIATVPRYSRIKTDTVIGLVLSSFFGLGVVLLTRIQRMSFGDQSGLDKYLFGDAAALGRGDLYLMAIVTAVVVSAIILLFRHFQVTSFDADFASALGMPARAIQLVLMTLLALAIVVALQAVGVVLVSAMLVTPAATAYLLTDRVSRMLVLSAVIGVAAGLGGLFLSFVLNRMPTGPCMVLAASTMFGLAFCFAPRQGVLFRAIRRARQRRRVERENLLKTAYGLLEHDRVDRVVSYLELAAQRSESVPQVQRLARNLAAVDMARPSRGGITLTPRGMERAAQIVRNHRLWELFLTREASIAADHVHRDAEEIEHVLGEEIVAQLEAMLDHPERDPHGSVIPKPAASLSERESVHG